MQQAGEYIRERELPDKRERGKNTLRIKRRTKTLRKSKGTVYHSV